MSSSVHIFLPPNAALERIACALGKLVGAETAQIVQTGFPELVKVTFFETITDAPTMKDRQINFHFDNNAYPSLRVMSAPSDPFYLAVAHRLVDFFGGIVDYIDTDDIDINYQQIRKSDKTNCPSIDPQWDGKDTAVTNIQPLTLAEIERFTNRAAYPNLTY